MVKYGNLIIIQHLKKNWNFLYFLFLIFLMTINVHEYIKN
jgi:hypothetical protein